MGATKDQPYKRISRRTGPEKVGREFAQAVDLNYASLASQSYGDTARVLRRIEKDHVERLSGYPQFALELRRRTAELLLDQALVHGCSLAQCRSKLNQAARLGWTSIERRLHFQLLYARGMVARGHLRTATAMAHTCILHIQRELKRIERLPKRRGRKYFLDWLGLMNEVLQHVKASEGGSALNGWDVGGHFIQNQHAKRR